MSVCRDPSTGCYSSRAWADTFWARMVRFGPFLLLMVVAAPSLPSAFAPRAVAAHVQAPRVEYLEVLVTRDGWVLRRPSSWSEPLDDADPRRLGPGRAYVARGPGSDAVLLATASDLMSGRRGVISLRAGERVPWRELVYSAEVLGPLRVTEAEGELGGFWVDARPGML